MVYSPQLVELDPQMQPMRRLYPRQTLRSLAYVKLDQGNGGIVRDLTEAGMAVQAVARLQAGQEVHVQFELLSPRVRVDVRGRVVWSDPSGQGGINFLDLTARTQRSLRDWLFTQLLASAAMAGRDSMFVATERELIFSAAARPAIVVEPEFAAHAEKLETSRVSWGFISLSARSFSIFVDMLVLLCAILLFSISSVAVMGGLPEWPLAAALFLTTSTIFVAVYQLLFSDVLCGASPGNRLARLAMIQNDAEDDIQRFR
jgi:hypothetical protein